jgi:AhpD family alkylhydroperoxidase
MVIGWPVRPIWRIQRPVNIQEAKISTNQGSSSPKEMNMSRKEVYREIEDMFGVVPAFFKAIPDSSLEMEWQLFRRVQFEPGPIPNKYRELIGLGIAAVSKCRYCVLFHTEAAKLNGATDAEIEDAVHFAKSSAGWSAYLNGLAFDFEDFKAEVQQIVRHVRKMQEQQKDVRHEARSTVPA